MPVIIDEFEVVEPAARPPADVAPPAGEARAPRRMPDVREVERAVIERIERALRVRGD
jgi:hypothetical protein